MAEVLLFHHSQGQTPGFLAFADGLGQAGHTVHTPDLFDGKTFESIDDGMAHIQELGFSELIERGVQMADELSTELVYAGFSFGVMAAQKLAQTRAGARGALFFESCAPPDYYAPSWPVDLPVQIHGKDADPFFVGEGDVEYARTIVATSTDGELFLYPGDQHLFADSSLRSYDAEATALLTRRVLDFLTVR